MKAGTMIAHGREWPLYEVGLMLMLSPEDQVEKEALDVTNYQSYPWD